LPRLGAIVCDNAHARSKAAVGLRVIRNPSRAYPSRVGREWWQRVMTVQLNIGGPLASVKFLPAGRAENRRESSGASVWSVTLGNKVPSAQGGLIVVPGLVRPLRKHNLDLRDLFERN
jgi:hypothetical protein